MTDFTSPRAPLGGDPLPCPFCGSDAEVTNDENRFLMCSGNRKNGPLSDGDPCDNTAAFSLERWNRRASGLPGAGEQTEAFKALGRLYNHNTDPDGVRAEYDRMTVFNALRGNAYDERFSFLMEYLNDVGTTQDILIREVDTSDSTHRITRERKSGYGDTDENGLGERESVWEAVERDLMEYGTDEAKAEYKAITVPAPVRAALSVREERDENPRVVSSHCGKCGDELNDNDLCGKCRPLRHISLNAPASTRWQDDAGVMKLWSSVLTEMLTVIPLERETAKRELDALCTAVASCSRGEPTPERKEIATSLRAGELRAALFVEIGNAGRELLAAPEDGIPTAKISDCLNAYVLAFAAATDTVRAPSREQVAQLIAPRHFTAKRDDGSYAWRDKTFIDDAYEAADRIIATLFAASRAPVEEGSR